MYSFGRVFFVVAPALLMLVSAFVYLTYADEIPAKIRPAKDTALFLSLLLSAPYCMSFVLSMQKRTTTVVILELYSWFFGCAIIAAFSISVVSLRRGEGVLDSVIAVYPVVCAWLIQCACATLAFLVWLVGQRADRSKCPPTVPPH